MAATVTITLRSSAFLPEDEDPIAEDQKDEPTLSNRRTPGRHASELADAAPAPAAGSRRDWGGGLSDERLMASTADFVDLPFANCSANWSGFHNSARLFHGASGSLCAQRAVTINASCPGICPQFSISNDALRLRIDGHVRQPTELGLRDLTRLSEVQLTPVNQASGSRRQNAQGLRIPIKGRTDSSKREFCLVTTNASAQARL
jgi:hypothetical protein